MGLTVIPVLLSYLVFATLFPIYLARRAKKQGGKGWIWGWGMFLLLWGLAFWEWPFNTMTHNYYCKNEAGFKIHQTLEEWKLKNPGVAGNFVPNSPPKKTEENNTTKYQLNERFSWNYTRTKYWFDVVKIEEQIIDIKTNEKIAEYIDFDGKRFEGGEMVFAFWDGRNSCEHGVKSRQGTEFNGFLQSVKLLGNNK